MPSKTDKLPSLRTSIIFFVAVALAEGFIQILENELFGMTKDWLASSPVSLPVLSWIFTALMIISIVMITVIWLKKPSSKKSEPNFDEFLEAYFFYPKKYSRERGERDPKKIVPRKKLVLIKDSRKAYYVGEYALNLVLTDKLTNWFTEDETKELDLDSWCTQKGYTLIPENGDENKLLEPYFEAEIKDKKEEYRLGDIVLFRTHFRGFLNHGLFDNEIMHCEGKKFPRGKFHRKRNRDWSWPTETLSVFAKLRFWIEVPIFRGKLNGYVDKEVEWHWCIPFGAPLGQYRIYMRVYNGSLPQTIREREDTITVVALA
jgi:hypothetical protein